jgi:hypothetical protein
MNAQVHDSEVVLDRSDCAHSETRVEILPPGQIHYARVVCCDCGKQLCWTPHPANVARRQLNAVHLRELLDKAPLTDYERGLCEGLITNQRLSPRQQALLDALTDTYLRKDKQFT